jgi:hypothetical protein
VARRGGVRGTSRCHHPHGRLKAVLSFVVVDGVTERATSGRHWGREGTGEGEGGIVTVLGVHGLLMMPKVMSPREAFPTSFRDKSLGELTAVSSEVLTELIQLPQVEPAAGTTECLPFCDSWLGVEAGLVPP